MLSSGEVEVISKTRDYEIGGKIIMNLDILSFLPTVQRKVTMFISLNHDSLSTTSTSGRGPRSLQKCSWRR